MPRAKSVREKSKLIASIAENGDINGSDHIVRAVADFAAQSMTTTAEGDENEDQLSAPARMGFNEMQGFLFSRPV